MDFFFQKSLENIPFNPELKGIMIGPGGSTIKLIEQTGAKIRIDGDTIKIFAPNKEILSRAAKMVSDLLRSAALRKPPPRPSTSYEQPPQTSTVKPFVPRT